MTQACCRLWRVRPEAEFAALAFEIVDWILGFQQKSGAFLNDHQPDTPGYTSALYLEALGSAACVALSLQDMVNAHDPFAIGPRKRFVLVFDGFRVDDNAIEQTCDAECKVENAGPSRFERARRRPVCDNRSTGKPRRG